MKPISLNCSPAREHTGLQTILFALTLALLAAPAVRAQAAPPAPGIVLPRGTLVTCVLDDTLSWNSTTVGDGVTCLSDPVSAFGYRSLLPRGAEFLGQISDIKSPKPFSIGDGKLNLHFDSIALDAFTEVPMSAKITSVSGAGIKLHVDREGNLVGPGLTHWDIVMALFPGTDIYKLITLPARRPGPVIRGEVAITLRLQRALELPAPAAVATPARAVQPLASAVPAAVPAVVPAAALAADPAAIPALAPAPEAVASVPARRPCVPDPGWHCFGGGPV